MENLQKSLKSGSKTTFKALKPFSQETPSTTSQKSINSDTCSAGIKSATHFEHRSFSRCAQDPVHFMRKYCYIQHPHKGKIKFNLYDFQETALTELRDNDYNVILKSRQLGISTLSAGYSLWLMLFHNDKNILVIATKQEVAKNLVTKVRVMHDGLPGWLKGNCVEDNKLSLRFSNGSQVKAISSSGDAGRLLSLSSCSVFSQSPFSALFIDSGFVCFIFTPFSHVSSSRSVCTFFAVLCFCFPLSLTPGCSVCSFFVFCCALSATLTQLPRRILRRRLLRCHRCLETKTFEASEF